MIIGREELLNSCSGIQAALEAEGLRATTDACPRQTPGAKYNAWENRGVPLRVEIGVREIASDTFCLAVHPCVAHLVPAASRAAADAAAPDGAAAAAAAAAGAPVEGAGSPPSQTPAKPNLRLGGLSRRSLVAACKAVLQADHVPKPHCEAGAGAGGGAAALGTGPGRPAGRQWCRKLHLWPDQLAAWGDTASAVAALLATLSASTSPPARQGTCGGGGGRGDSSGLAGAVPGGPASCTSADGSPGAAGLATAHGSQAVGPEGPPQRPCVAHLRSLLGQGRPCHCGRGHCDLAELRREVERRCGEEMGQQVLEWVAGPEGGPSGGPGRPGHSQQMQQQQQQQHHRQQRQRPAGGAIRAQARAGRAADGAMESELAAGDGLEDPAPGTEAVEADEEGDEVWDEAPGSAAGERVVLLVGNIPPDVKVAAVQAELAAAFEPYGCLGVSLSRTRSGGSHGWARVTLSGPGAAAAAAQAVKQLDGELRLGGAPLSVSPSAGRLDTIFPYLPYAVRAAMRVDATAAYSATDQATADKMTDLLAGLAERLLLPPPPPSPAAPSPSPPVPSGSPDPGDPEQQQPQQGDEDEEQQRKQGRQDHHRHLGSSSPPPRLLPLAVTDGTACCGGNALSFARRFRRVVAVELDEDRAADLRHNAALVRAWASFRRSQQQQQQPLTEGTASAETTVAPGGGSDRGVRPPAETPGAGRGAGASGASDDEVADLGELAVLCGDYTRLAGGLRQDIVFVDPPWGGPQYLTAAPGASPREATAPGRVSGGGGGGSGAAVATPAATANVAVAGGRKLEYGDAAFVLGEMPLSHLLSELLAGSAAGAGGTAGGGGGGDGSGGGGAARMVAAKLPSRTDGELRAMQARVRHLVTERLRARAAGAVSGGAGGGGGSDGGASEESGTAGPEGEDAAEGGEGGWRLLGAEVTLGRSALVVFVMVPSQPDGAGAGRGAAIQGNGGGRGDGEGEEDGWGAGGACGPGESQVLAPARRGRERGGGGGSSFRAVLRECCVALNLPYRVICD